MWTDPGWFINLCSSHLQSQSEMYNTFVNLETNLPLIFYLTAHLLNFNLFFVVLDKLKKNKTKQIICNKIKETCTLYKAGLLDNIITHSYRYNVSLGRWESLQRKNVSHYNYVLQYTCTCMCQRVK